MGSQAEMLRSKLKLKRIGTDTILLWLVFSKVAYEFAIIFLMTYLRIYQFPTLDMLHF